MQWTLIFMKLRFCLFCFFFFRLYFFFSSFFCCFMSDCSDRHGRRAATTTTRQLALSGPPGCRATGRASAADGCAHGR